MKKKAIIAISVLFILLLIGSVAFVVWWFVPNGYYSRRELYALSTSQINDAYHEVYYIDCILIQQLPYDVEKIWGFDWVSEFGATVVSDEADLKETNNWLEDALNGVSLDFSSDKNYIISIGYELESIEYHLNEKPTYVVDIMRSEETLSETKRYRVCYPVRIGSGKNSIFIYEIPIQYIVVTDRLGSDWG